jgi:hypothetical protein
MLAEFPPLESPGVKATGSIECHHVIGDPPDRGRDAIRELHEDIRRAYPLTRELGKRVDLGIRRHHLELPD